MASTKINKAFLNGKVYLAKAYPANEQRNTDGTVVRRAYRIEFLTYSQIFTRLANRSKFSKVNSAGTKVGG